MKKLALLLFPFLLLVGCAQNTWYKPSARPGDFEKDRYDCLQQSQQQYSRAQTNGWQGASESKVVTNDGLFSSCMNARGWSIQNQQAVQQQIQQQQNNQSSTQSQFQSESTRLTNEAKANCANPEFKPYYSKTACTALEITFEQLADSTKITPAQKAVLPKLRAVIDENLKARNALNRRAGGRNAKIADYVVGNIMPQNDKNNLDLYNGKITWGEYNQRRKDINVNGNNAIKNIQ